MFQRRTATVKKFEELKKELQDLYVERKKIHEALENVTTLIDKNRDQYWKLNAEIEKYNKTLDPDAVEAHKGPTLWDLQDRMFHYEEYEEHGDKNLNKIISEWDRDDKQFQQAIHNVKMASLRKMMRNR